MEENRKKALAAALGQIEKQFGKGSVMRLGEASESYDVESVSTGSLGLDIALGIGGLPRGRVVEIYGPESSGKTTLTLQVIAEAQRAGGTAAFVDAEHALDPVYAAKLGVNVQDLLVSQPDTGEQALEITDMLVRSGAVDIVVVDSVAALTPKAEIEGEMGDAHVGLQARLMSQALRKLTGNIKRSNTIVIFINQIRMKIGVMFGNPETTTGGNALKFYASVRLDIRRIGALKNGEEVIGNQTRVKVVKNKVAPPFREAEFEILYGQGISRNGEVIDIGVAQGFVEKSGSWFSYNGERIGQGKENARTFLDQHPEIAREIEGRIREKLLPAKGEKGEAMKGEATVSPDSSSRQRRQNRRSSRHAAARRARAFHRGAAPQAHPKRVPCRAHRARHSEAGRQAAGQRRALRHQLRASPRQAWPGTGPHPGCAAAAGRRRRPGRRGLTQRRDRLAAAGPGCPPAQVRGGRPPQPG
jgi:recombination protein RecA